MFLAGRCSTPRWIAALACALSLAACEVAVPPDDGPAPPFAGSKINIEIRSVTIASPPVVEFSVTNELGTPVPLTQAYLDAGAVSFTLAKLVPGVDGDADSWQSYINHIEVPTPGVGPGGVPALPGGSMQATAESDGILTHLGAGLHRYRFATDVTNPAQTMDVVYDPTLTHRVVIQARFTGTKGLTAANGQFDFVPDGSPVTTTKQVAATDSCNRCHTGRLAMHAGRAVEVGACVACHNPGTTDANSGNNLDLAVLVHKVHMGEDLTQGFRVWGEEDEEKDYSDLPYPQDHRNCTQCHSGTNPSTPDGDNWKTRPTQQACGACHDDVDFNTHVPGIPMPPGDNRLCVACHVSEISDRPEVIQTAHTRFDQMAAGWFRYNILDVTQTRPGQRPQVTFEVTDPRDGSRYDILNDPEFDPSNGARVALLIGWGTTDYHNSGSGATVGPPEPNQPTEFPAPGQPVSIDVLGNATDTGGKVFMVQMPMAVPLGAGGTGVVALEGHPAAIVDPVRNPGVYDTVPVDNAFAYFSITDVVPRARREVVSLDKCNRCHDRLSMHGGNRQGALEVCVICHNPDATDIAQRPATLDVAPQDGDFDNFRATDVDGKREETIHFKYMIHAIHAGEAREYGIRSQGIVLRGYGRNFGGPPDDYARVRFPGVIQNCRNCHEGESYRVPTPYGSLGTTVQTADPLRARTQNAAESALRDSSDDLNISPMASACGSCHDSAQARRHITHTGGGSFGATQVVLDGVYYEACDGCHGRREIKDVGQVHPIEALP